MKYKNLAILQLQTENTEALYRQYRVNIDGLDKAVVSYVDGRTRSNLLGDNWQLDNH